MPKVTALMPLYNGRTYIEESLQSVQAQTFTDWEFIIVNDFGSDDGCADIVKQYAEKDPRIKLVQLEERLGLAASLNVGLDMAQGEYVARVDVDDPSEPDRFAKQVDYMDAHPEISLCSCWQTSITPNKCYIQKVAVEAEELKAAMLFGCEISHCGVMLRKSDFDSHHWRYDPTYFGEDYELWTRAMSEGAKMVNIPEALVCHRWGFENISIAKGESLRDEVREISIRSLKAIGVNAEEYNRYLFSGWRNRPEQYAKEGPGRFLRDNYQLIKEIFEKNHEKGFFDEKALKKILLQRWDWARKSCGISFAEIDYNPDFVISGPKTSIIITNIEYSMISKTIDSILTQNDESWELLILLDKFERNGIVELCQMYAWKDPRIRILQTDEALNTSELINRCIPISKGKYISRIDCCVEADPNWLTKQISYLEANPDHGICGAWIKHHYEKKGDWVQKPTADSELLRCRLLFWCDISYCAVTIKKEAIPTDQLYLNTGVLAEDFEFSSRVMQFTKITNIPEVLATYHHSADEPTKDINLLSEESARIISNTVKNILNHRLSLPESWLLADWKNPIPLEQGEERRQALEQFRDVLTQIWDCNQNVQFFDNIKLLETLAAKWFGQKDNINWRTADYSSIIQLQDIFAFENYRDLQNAIVGKTSKPGVVTEGKSLLRRYFLHPIARFFRKIMYILMKDLVWEINKDIERWTWERYKRTKADIEDKKIDYGLIDKKIERWTWERYKRIENKLPNIDKLQNQLADLQYSEKSISLFDNEKIKIIFLFQIASFWPSWDSFYQACCKDDRIEAKLLFLDETYSEETQMKSARDFLENWNGTYFDFDKFDIDSFNPHVIVIQTPYDKWHRIKAHWSAEWKSKGYRIVYIPYGIEISDTSTSRELHFEENVIENAWRIYTFSETMREDYRKYCKNADAVKVFGLPKFDTLYYKEQLQLSDDLIERIGNRKICLWKVHFPKIFTEKGKDYFATPDPNEYIKFTHYIISNPHIFFIFMPHPKFADPVKDKKLSVLANTLLYNLDGIENVYIDTTDDYRYSLVNADFIIIDRSAVMVEAAAVGVPVLYMVNKDFYEPVTKAIEPLIESYEQGTTCKDMIRFTEACIRGEDKKKAERESAFRECIPYFDGKCGERIKDDIVQSLMAEAIVPYEVQLANQAVQLEERINRLEQQVQQTLSKSIEQTEESLAKRTDNSIERWTWERYKRTATALEQTEESLAAKTDNSVEHWTWERYKRLRAENDQLRRQIDYTYRDIMIVLEKQLEFVGRHNIQLITDYPIAYESLDTIVPHGTVRDNTRYPRFIKKCESIFKQNRELSFLDLGCSGGGMVLDAVLRGHLGIGLEGCNVSLIDQRAEWRLLRENLFTCDISKPFELYDNEAKGIKQFHVITAWEVIEHIREEDLPQLLLNIRKHLLPDGYFIASIANYDDIDPETGVNWHVTVHPYNWWKERFESAGFVVCEGLLETADLARGGYNPPNAWQAPSTTVDTEKCFSIAVQVELKDNE